MSGGARRCSVQSPPTVCIVAVAVAVAVAVKQSEHLMQSRQSRQSRQLMQALQLLQAPQAKRYAICDTRYGSQCSHAVANEC